MILHKYVTVTHEVFESIILLGDLNPTGKGVSEETMKKVDALTHNGEWSEEKPEWLTEQGNNATANAIFFKDYIVLDKN